MPAPATSAELRRLVALGCHVLGANGHADYVWGHVAARDPQGRGIWMKPATYGFEEIGADDVILVGWDGDVLEGDRPRHSEWPIHAELMRVRDDLGATVHSHPPHSIGLAASGQELLPLSHAGTLFAPPDVPRFTKTANLIVTRPMGEDVAAAMGELFALLLVNHGIVTAGKDVRDAVIRAVLLEKAAHQQMVANAFGPVAHFSPDDEALAKRETVWAEHHLVMLWDYLVRTLPGESRGAAS